MEVGGSQRSNLCNKSREFPLPFFFFFLDRLKIEAPDKYQIRGRKEKTMIGNELLDGLNGQY